MSSISQAVAMRSGLDAIWTRSPVSRGVGAPACDGPSHRSAQPEERQLAADLRAYEVMELEEVDGKVVKSLKEATQVARALALAVALKRKESIPYTQRCHQA